MALVVRLIRLVQLPDPQAPANLALFVSALRFPPPSCDL
jgi:hypothetical protein